MLPIPLPTGLKGYVSTVGEKRGGDAFGAFNLADHVGDESENVLLNRRRLQKQLNCPDIQWLRQVHGVRCVEVAGVEETAIEADAAFTVEANVALAVLTADCLPIVIWGERELAVCHAGWRGLVDGVVTNTVARFSNPIGAWIGPAISATNYEVGQEVWHRFDDGMWRDHLHAHREDGAKRLLDLPAMAAQQLRELGVSEVELSGLCTYEDQRFYSHRRHSHMSGQGECGRFATLVWRQETGATGSVS